MVNENLINLTNNKKPIETVQEIEKYEIKKSPLSLATKAKVINKSGSNYLSEDKEGYGPCTSPNCPHSREELQDQLREERRELEDLKSQLSRASSWNVTIIEQNITIVQTKIKIIVKIIRDRYPWLAARIDLTFKGFFCPCAWGKPEPLLTAVSSLSVLREGLGEFLESGGLSDKIIRINNIEKLQRFQSSLSRQVIVIATGEINSNIISIIATRQLVTPVNDVGATTSCLRKVDELIRDWEEGKEITGTYSF